MQYASLREKIAAETAVRRQRYVEFKNLFDRAHYAGIQAGQACRPTPMIVGSAKTLFGNDIDFSKKTYFEADGVCGFAWVKIRPATSSFARWLVKNDKARTSYRGGVDIRVKDFGQSMQRKEAYARAFATVLVNAGIDAYCDSRMD